MSHQLSSGKFSRHNPAVPDIGPRRTRSFETPGQQSFARPMVNEPNAIPPTVGFDIRGKVGQTVYQMAFPPPWSPQAGQPKQLQRRRHVIPKDPRTMAQLMCRARWAAGVAAWHQLSAADVANWNDAPITRSRNITGYQAFMKYFCTSHLPNEYHAMAVLWTAQPALPFLTGI